MAVVAFDLAGFRARYPEFAAVADPTLAAYFAEAGLYLDNTDQSVVTDVVRRSALLNMLVAHIGKLAGAIDGGAPSGIVGRVETAGQGSVSVTAKYADATPGTMAWYIQTTYGAAFWQATAAFRQFAYTRCNYPLP